MKKLLIATGNAGKVREIKAIFNGVYDEIVSLKDEGINIDVVEDGDTFLANARKKAYEISLLVDCDVLADDSGLCVDCLNGEPGVYSARYAGEQHNDDDNNEKLVREVSAFPENERTGRYVCSISVYNKGKEICFGEGTCDGKIVTEPKGTNGFGYDPYFFVEEFGKTMAELDPEVKNSISHRGRALEAVREQLA